MSQRLKHVAHDSARQSRSTGVRSLADGSLRRLVCRGRGYPLWALCTLTLVIGTLEHRAAQDEAPSDGAAAQGVGASPEERQAALEQLETAGRRVGETVDGLVQFVEDSTVPIDLRSRAAVALGETGLRNAEQAARLFRVLGDPTVNDELRWTLLMTFGDRPEWEGQRQPVLLGILSDSTQGRLLRQQALFGLRASLDAPAVAEAVREVLERVEEDPSLRDAVLEAMRLHGESGPDLVKLLAERAVDSSETAAFRGKVLRVLETWKTEAGAVLPILVEAALDSGGDPGMRLQIVKVIGQIDSLGPLASVLGALVLRPEEPPELRQAVAALPGLDPRLMPGSIGEWVAVTKDRKLPAAAHTLALQVLGQRGGERSDAGLLRQCLDWLGDPNEVVTLRLEAAKYLQTRSLDLDSVRGGLAKILEDPVQPEALREQIGAVLVEIARSWLTSAELSTREELLRRIAAVDALRAQMNEVALPSSAGERQRQVVQQVFVLLQREWHSRGWDRFVWWAGRNRLAASGMALLGMAGLVALGYGLRRLRSLPTARAPQDDLHPVPLTEPTLGVELQTCMDLVLAPDNPDRSEAVERLGRFGPELEPALPALSEVLRNRDQELDLRFAALTVMGMAGPVASSARPVLTHLLEDLREPVYLRLKVLEVLEAWVGQDSAFGSEAVKRLIDPQEVLLVRLKAGQLLRARSSKLVQWRDDLRNLARESESTELSALARELLTQLES